MSARPWYKRYGGDFVLGTMSLTLEEKGAYSLCLDLIYDRGGPIPDDARWLSGVCGVSLRKWASLRARLIETGKLTAQDGVLSNKRSDKEIAASTEKTENRAENGAKGGRKRAENASKTGRKRAENASKTVSNAPEIMVDHNENSDLAQVELKPIQKPDTRSQKEEKKRASAPPPPELFEEAWRAYPHVVGRSSKAASLAHWQQLPEPERTALPQACERARRNVTVTWGGKGAPAMDRWLRDGKHVDWLEPDRPRPALVVTDDVKRQRLAHYRETGEWRSTWGDPPEDSQRASA